MGPASAAATSLVDAPAFRGPAATRGRQSTAMTRTSAPKRRVVLTLFSVLTIAVLALAGEVSAGVGESSPLPRDLERQARLRAWRDGHPERQLLGCRRSR